MISAGRSRKSLVLDTTLAVLVFLLGLTSQVDLGESIRPFTREPDALNTFLIALQSLPLILRRRYPRSVLLVVVAAWIADRVLDYPSTLVTAGLILVFHAIGTELPPRTSFRLGLALTGVMAGFTAIGAIVLNSVDAAAVVVTIVATAAPIALGREVHQRRLQFQELEDRATRAEKEREQQAREAVEKERARIARELHDIVAHQMAVMTVQAEGARRLARDADPRIGEALDVIRGAGHEALAEMRQMVGLLRSEEDTPEEPTLAPQPGLDRIVELGEHMTEAGLPVLVEVTGEARAIPPGLDVSAFRIVQESLTNSLKHAGVGAKATVTVAYEPDALRLHIVDNGVGAAAALGEHDSGGHGLVGMRERVAVAGGTFRAGPRPGGGFEVTAELPTTS